MRTKWTRGLGAGSAGHGVQQRSRPTKGRQLIAQCRVQQGLRSTPKRARFTPRSKASNATARQLLLEDDSEFALRPDNGSELHEICSAVDGAIADGINDRTASGERSAMNKYYIPYARSLGTAVWRTTAAAMNPFREGAYACGFALRVWKQMKARTKADKLARVDSVRSVIGHVRRAHSRKGYSFASTSMMAHVMKGLSRRRLLAVGVAVIRRAEPFTTQELVATKTMTPGAKVGSKVYQPSAIFWAGWRLVDTYSDQTGARKAEVVGDGELCFHHDDVQFSLDGVTCIDPSSGDLARIVAGHFRTVYVTVAVGTSKADQDGSKFGQHLVSLLYNRANPMSFAVAIVDYLIMFPVRGSARATTPLFTTDGKTPWTASQIDTTLTNVMIATLTPQQRKGKTFHSKRVFCATGFRDLDSSDGEIQALVRWSSIDSIRIYARMGLLYQARRRDLLQTATIDAMNAAARPLPQIDPTHEDQVAEAGAATELARALERTMDTE